MVPSLKVLGQFAICDGDGAELSLSLRKARALLGYLAANADRPQQREHLMALLWSDRTRAQARHSLNQVLFAIRKVAGNWGSAFFDCDDEKVTLRSDAIECDIVQFYALLNDYPLEAAELYRAPLLDGLAIADSTFEEWLTQTRSAIQEQACEALERGADAARREGDTKTAIAAARRLVSLDPLREEGHRRLMQLLHTKGDRTGALRQYLFCVDILRRELQIEPDVATASLFHKIRNDKTPPASLETLSIVSEARHFDVPVSPPDIPSIAILPFDNLGGDPAQSFLSDGIAEDIITELSRFRSLFVIARGSSFSFKGRSIDTREIASRLNVRYILEGSLRAHGSRMRVTAQLIDAESGHHIWSERYDRETENIFAVQDDITRNIVGIIEPVIAIRERERVRLRGSKQLDAWAQYQSGLAHYYMHERTELDRAIACFSDAISADPNFAAAYAMRANAQIRKWIYFKPQEREELLAAAREAAETAIRLDSQDARGPLTLGRVQTLLGNSSAALALVDRALELNPNLAMAHYAKGFVLVNCEPSEERLEESIRAFDQAVRLSPNDPYLAGFMMVRARALLQLKRYREAADCAQIACQSPSPRPWAFAFLTIALRQLGNEQGSQTALDDLLRRFPDFTVQFARRMEHWPVACRDYFEELLKAAGVPE